MTTQRRVVSSNRKRTIASVVVSVPQECSMRAALSRPLTDRSSIRANGLRDVSRDALSTWAKCRCQGRFRIGTSLPFPHWTPAVVPVAEYRRYHVPLDGRKTAMSVFPSPS